MGGKLALLETAKSHFDNDISRSRTLLSHASGVADDDLKKEIFRCALMYGVGAVDAYFCDAYADLITRAIRAKERQKSVSIPDRLNNLTMPVADVLNASGSGWGWRMAARKIIEKQNVLSIDEIKNLFNHFFEDGKKPMSSRGVEGWILHSKTKQRHVSFSKTEYRNATPSTKKTLKGQAVDRISDRYSKIFQRRHDCIHNCDRPKMGLQKITESEAKTYVEDLEVLVEYWHEKLKAALPEYLGRLGFSTTTITNVC